MSFCPDDIFKAIKKEMPNFTITYQPDFRQAIANSWPKSIDESIAQRDWNLSYQYDLESMTKVMLTEIKKKF